QPIRERYIGRWGQTKRDQPLSGWRLSRGAEASSTGARAPDHILCSPNPYSHCHPVIPPGICSNHSPV
ncbi:hypothetical protein LEMLEM_LOCUS17270, partial [Lemmus lemmus]